MVINLSISGLEWSESKVVNVIGLLDVELRYVNYLNELQILQSLVSFRQCGMNVVLTNHQDFI